MPKAWFLTMKSGSLNTRKDTGSLNGDGNRGVGDMFMNPYLA